MAIWLNSCLGYIVFPFLSPTEPSENFREILQNVAKPHGVSNMRKLGHLNNFIKVMLSSHDTFTPVISLLTTLRISEFLSPKTNMKTLLAVQPMSAGLAAGTVAG